MTKILLATAAAALTIGPSTPAQTASPEDLAARLQARQATINSFTARFTQEMTAKFLPQKERSSGTIKVLKPDRLWMAYEKPGAKHFVADGKFVWDYDVPNKYATKDPMPKDPGESISLMLLAGRADLTRDFTSALAPTAPATEWHLVLTPKSNRSEFRTLTMMVTRDALKLIGLVTVDDQGSTHTYRFTDLVENARLQPGDFLLKLPSTVHIESR